MGTGSGSDRRVSAAALESLEELSTEPGALSHARALAAELEALQIEPDLPLAGACAALVWDGAASLEAVRRSHPGDLSRLVASTLSLEEPGLAGMDRADPAPAQVEALRKLLLAMADDVRVILIRLAEQLLRMRAAREAGPGTQRRLALETRDIYAPIANRLGIWPFKWELEDLAFRFLEPETYHRIAGLLAQSRSERESYIAAFVSILEEKLGGAGIAADIRGRPKHIYSIWRKMQRKGVDFEQVFDTLAVRVLVDDLAACYAALGVVHGLWRYIPGEFDDYIANPKGNDYRSLHTAVLGPQGRAVEIQIRTRDMHREAELGVAAHWRYKEGGRKDPEFERKIAWLRQLLEPGEEVSERDRDFIDRFRSELFDDRVYVLTPLGDVVDLPQGATPLDFAYHVHTELGHRCRGARVNGRMVPLTHRLANGDHVEVLPARTAGPSRDWLIPQLGYLASARSRAKVRQWFRRQAFDRNREEGEALLDKELQRLDLAADDRPALAKRFNHNSVDSFHAAIGSGELTVAEVTGALERRERQRREASTPTQRPHAPRAPGRPGDHVHIQGVGNLLTHIARCCRPVPGDPITGFITRGHGVTVHRSDCNNILRHREDAPERLMTVQWAGPGRETYPVSVRIQALDRPDLVRDVTQAISEAGVNISGLTTEVDPDRVHAALNLTLQVQDLEQLSGLLTRLGRIGGVREVRRKR